MKTGIYFCKCGSNISDKIDPGAVCERIKGLPDNVYFKTVDFMCSEDGLEFLKQDLKQALPDRVIIAACSPRDHEGTFMRALSGAGLNPYLMHMVNVREQVAWVTKDKEEAVAKAVRLITGALGRVGQQGPLEKREIDICTDVLVIGAGPAGLKAALGLAAAGRRVTIVEKSPVIGGMPVRYEELFPGLECGSCMLEPMLAEVLYGEFSSNIELLTCSELKETTGYYGNFTAKIARKPRYVELHKCVGCSECVDVCPVSEKNKFNFGLDDRKAVYVPFEGGLPNVPVIDEKICLRLNGGECNLCKDACPVDGAINYEDREQLIEKNAGAIILAVGSGVYDCRKIPDLGYGRLKDILTAPEFERVLASNGPTGGEIKTHNGKKPKSIAIVHCVGSLDKNHKEYCSGICCQYAFKFNQLTAKKLPGTKFYHFYKELSSPGKEEAGLYSRAKDDPHTTFIRYTDISDLQSGAKGPKRTLTYKKPSGRKETLLTDMVILCPAVVPSESSVVLGAALDVPSDRFGFYEALHSRLDAAQSKIKGIFIAGSCQAPMDIQKAINQGMAAAGYVLSGLAAGRKLEVSPVHAEVISERCSGCRVCTPVCPYKAIAFDSEEKVAWINDVLCQGCGTCVAACPAGAIKGHHFTNRQILAEIEGLLHG